MMMMLMMIRMRMRLKEQEGAIKKVIEKLKKARVKKEQLGH